MQRWIAVLGIALTAACAPAEDEMQAEAANSTEPATEPAVAGAMMPDTTGPALWTWLQESDYRSWSLWPGRSTLYPGGEPHGMLLTTYLNEIALAAVEDHATVLPAGAVVVKENFMPDSSLAAITVMHKVPGYSTDAGDWFWAKYLPDGTAEAAGRVAGCIGCHGANAAADYLMTARPQ